MYVVVIFLSQVIFTFFFVSTSLAALPYPKRKEKRKLSEIKKINYNIYVYRTFFLHQLNSKNNGPVLILKSILR